MQDEATQLKKELRESKRRREAEKEEKEAQERGTNNVCTRRIISIFPRMVHVPDSYILGPLHA